MEIAEIKWPPENLIFSRPISWMRGSVVSVRTYINGEPEKEIHLAQEISFQDGLTGFGKIDRSELDCLLREATKCRVEIIRKPVDPDYYTLPEFPAKKASGGTSGHLKLRPRAPRD